MPIREALAEVLGEQVVRRSGRPIPEPPSAVWKVAYAQAIADLLVKYGRPDD